MINIAYIIDSIRRGGPGNVVKNLIDNIDKSKYSVFLITLFERGNDKDFADNLEKSGVRVFRLNSLSHTNCFYKGVRLIDELLNQNNIDILHSHGIIPDMISSKVKHSCFKLSTLHCVISNDYPSFYGKLKGSAMVLAHRHYLKRLDKVVCCSESVYKAMKNMSNSVFIRNGIKITEQATKIENDDIKKKNNEIIYIYTGQLVPGKNVLWLFDVFKKYHKPNEFLYVLGKGKLLDECNRIKDNNIKMLGFVKNINQYLDMADIYISASKSEGFSISLLDALKHGKGVLLSDIPSHMEVFDVYKSVYIGENFNENNFEQKMQTLRQNIDKISADKIKQFTRENMSAEIMANEYMKVYEDNLRGN